MAHDIPIILDRLRRMKGNATEGLVFDLLTAVEAVQTLLDAGSASIEEETAYHDSLHKVENWLLGQCSALADDLLNELSSYL